MRTQGKKTFYIITASLILAFCALAALPRLWLSKQIHWKIFKILLKTEHVLMPLPTSINDILLVTIDNDTLINMPERWPYSRSDFATVIKNLKDSGAKAVAFDFVFLGKSAFQDDTSLKEAINGRTNVVLPASINQECSIDLSASAVLGENIPTGIITKLQDSDEVTRRCLTYLVKEKEPNKAFLSWEMQILKTVKNINISTLKSDKHSVSFENAIGQKWLLPVDAETKSFLIHFRYGSADFKKLSFYRVFKGDFSPGLVKDKIVIVGLLSSLFEDLHNTSFGLMPGITLNANSFLALYSRDFLKEIPLFFELILVILGVILAAYSASLLKTSSVLEIITSEIAVFFAISYLLLVSGYIWDYFIFPLTVLICPLAGKKIYEAINRYAARKSAEIAGFDG